MPCAHGRAALASQRRIVRLDRCSARSRADVNLARSLLTPPIGPSIHRGSQPREANVPVPPDCIFHPTALTDEDRCALELAAALAVRVGAELHAVHASNDASTLERIPDVRPMLRRWVGDDLGDFELHRRVQPVPDDLVEALLDAVRDTKPDLIVTATHQHSFMHHLFRGAVAESLTVETSLPTLFVPAGGAVPLDHATGRVMISRIVLPAVDELACRAALPWAAWLAEVGADRGEIVLWHRGSPTTLADVTAPEVPGWTWRHDDRDGGADALENLIAAQAQVPGTVIVMPTEGHDSLRDYFVGSQTERVLHKLHSPLLSVPMHRR
jgi:nucleotide-binding universal stress UspA family protein